MLNNFHQVRPRILFQEIDNTQEWYCPDCEAKGTRKTLDFVNHTKREGEDRPNDDLDEITLCCAECCQENLYIKIETE